VQEARRRVDFRILGPLEVLDGDRVLALPGGRGRALLALLILHAGEVISTERLIDELWGETSPPTVVKALQGRVSDLRKRLEIDRGHGEVPPSIRTAPPGYVLDIHPLLIDANRFQQLLAKARETPAPERSTKLRQALGLWRGPALADFVYEPFAQRAITALEELRMAAIEMRVEADLELGLHDELIAELEALVAEHPFRERLRAQLILALYRAGRQGDALAAHRETRRALVEELGVEPGPMLRELEKAILQQDPSLDRQRYAETPTALVEPLSDAAKSWLPAERRTLTVIFVDVSVTGNDGTDPEAVRRVVARASDIAAGILRRHGATIEELVGDVVMGVFGIPVAHEDDVLRAARAAVELSSAVAPLTFELERDQRFRLAIRAGMESGEVVVGASGSSHARLSGDAVNVAADLQRAAGYGEVLVGDAAHGILRDAAVMKPVERSPLEGAGGSSTVWGLIDLVPGADAPARSLDAPMVGRTAELARLQDGFERAVRQHSTYRFTVLGDPGIGKSRLAAEFAEALGSSARVLTGHCPAYGEGITFRPLRQIVVQAAGSRRPEALAEVLAEEDDGEWTAAQVAGALGLTQEPVGGEELFPAFRRLFEILSDRDPLVITLEDVHWAEPTLLDLIDHVTGSARGPIFLLCLARPELIDERPTWGAGGRSSDTLFLEPLDATETEKLITDRMAGGTLPPEALARILDTAQGNPLFAEQMVAAFQDEGTVTIPASTDALLATRLDRLGPAERDLLRYAAVAGTDFPVDALVALVPEQARLFVDRHLQALQQKQLIRPARTGQDFGFRHVLIQRAAYRSMTREDRADLHRRFAEWLQTREPEALPELDEILGYHLEQAVGQRHALGLADERDAAVAASNARLRSIRHLGDREPLVAGEVPASAGSSAPTGGDARARRDLSHDGSSRRRGRCACGDAGRRVGRGGPLTRGVDSSRARADPPAHRAGSDELERHPAGGGAGARGLRRGGRRRAGGAGVLRAGNRARARGKCQ
jgi:DNA-binding SARP family transcriptional activator